MATWQASALCAALDLVEADRLFFGDGRTTNVAEARMLCLACPVIDQCRSACEAAETDCVTPKYMAGIWAGETHHERAARRRTARRQVAS